MQPSIPHTPVRTSRKSPKPNRQNPVIFPPPLARISPQAIKGSDGGYCCGVVAYKDLMGGPLHFTWYSFLYDQKKAKWKMAGPEAYNAYS
jgi:hypothetical protein